ncbi:hypothetical protein LZ198_22830 [Myxococcus sp. K15C18031901]|uniref:hypothetical protein n=1 Tax=Myxococcus dinghuensis TaxID=2906761 RepID=UPI0020A7DF10|nr:hypothetical protein [Myxococcus dinghuensis]MCP3101717.1 hypothetical protein [Myxococcus dinghuensis]
MSPRWSAAKALLLAGALLPAPPSSASPPRRGPPQERRMTPLASVPLARLQVTEGRLVEQPDGGLLSDGPRMRAVAPGWLARQVELRFTVLGPSEVQQPLASGAPRQQVGLKLRAKDGCNLVYVMWRVTPKPGIVVNYKRNPDQHRSADCGNQGYTVVKPSHPTRVDAPSRNTAHVLRARLEGPRLRVWADEALAWEGTLPDAALSFDGPVGMRSDNLRLVLRLLVANP